MRCHHSSHSPRPIALPQEPTQLARSRARSQHAAGMQPSRAAGTQRHTATRSDRQRHRATDSDTQPSHTHTRVHVQLPTLNTHTPHPAPSTQHPTRANLALSPPVRPRPSSRKIFFEKLSKYIGRGIKALLDRPDGLYCFRLHRDRVYYMSEAQATPQPLRHSHCEP